MILNRLIRSTLLLMIIVGSFGCSNDTAPEPSSDTEEVTSPDPTWELHDDNYIDDDD